MTYNELIESLSEIINNELIIKDGLSLTYKLNSDNHKKMSEHLFYKINKDNNSANSDEYEYTDNFELEFGGIIINFIIK